MVISYRCIFLDLYTLVRKFKKYISLKGLTLTTIFSSRVTTERKKGCWNYWNVILEEKSLNSVRVHESDFRKRKGGEILEGMLLVKSVATSKKVSTMQRKANRCRLGCSQKERMARRAPHLL